MAFFENPSPQAARREARGEARCTTRPRRPILRPKRVVRSACPNATNSALHVMPGSARNLRENRIRRNTAKNRSRQTQLGPKFFRRQLPARRGFAGVPDCQSDFIRPKRARRVRIWMGRGPRMSHHRQSEDGVPNSKRNPGRTVHAHEWAGCAAWTSPEPDSTRTGSELASAMRSKWIEISSCFHCSGIGPGTASTTRPRGRGRSDCFQSTTVRHRGPRRPPRATGERQGQATDRETYHGGRQPVRRCLNERPPPAL